MKNYLLSHQDNEILKEINQTYNGVMSVLHYDCGFDFSKPYRVVKHSGKFTIKSLERDYSITSGDNAAILYEDKFIKTLRLYTYPDGKNVTNYYGIISRTNLSEIDVRDFVTKKDFEEARKAGGVFYIFIQASSYKKESYKRFVYKCFSPADREFKGYYNFCDKRKDHSGYIIHYYRSELKARLKKYHTDQDKKNLNKKELSEEIERHTNIARKQKEVIVNLLNDADVLERANMRYLSDVQTYLWFYSCNIRDLSLSSSKSNFKWNLERCENSMKEVKNRINYYKENYIKA